MEEGSELKIWKYLDLAKFISLLTTNTLYFASPAQFQDLSEGSLPKSHADAWSKFIQESIVDPNQALRPQFAARSPAALKQFDYIQQKLVRELPKAQREATLRFGVSCWHKSEYESEAMWKLYSASGQGVAIESSVGQLRSSLGSTEGIQIASVRYADFDNDPIEKGHKHYGLFLKKKSFEHEKELRATILLPSEQFSLPANERGIAVDCNLSLLINKIYVSPLCAPYVASAVESLCRGKITVLEKPVIHSRLLSDRGYNIEISLPSYLSK